MKFLTYIALLLLPSISSATIKFISVSGVSATNIGAVSIVGNPEIYGGAAGPVAGCPTDNTSTCNSCDLVSGLNICNRKRIYPGLKVTFTISSDKTPTGTPVIVSGSSLLTGQTNGGPVSIKNPGTVTVEWRQLCLKLGNGTVTSINECAGLGALQTATAEFKVGIDENGDGTIAGNDDYQGVNVTFIEPDGAVSPTGDYDTIDDHTNNTVDKPGIEQFTAYPGDEKIYFEDIQAGGGFPSTGLGKLKSINVYYSEGGWITTPRGYTPRVLEITTDGTEVANKIVDELPNQTNLYFRASVSDPSGNELFFTSDLAINTLCPTGNIPTTLPLPPFSGPTGTCPFAATPDEVEGLLNKNLSCFIATAAYGSPFHPIVADLRKFRDRFLLPTRWGRAFVEKYYEISPSAATWISEHRVIRKIVQVLLVPVWMGSLAAMWWPYTLLFGLGSLMIWRRYRKEKRG